MILDEMNSCLHFRTRWPTCGVFIRQPLRMFTTCVCSSRTGMKFALTALGLPSRHTGITTKGRSWSGWTDGDSFTSLGRTREDGGNQRSDGLVKLYECMCVYAVCARGVSSFLVFCWLPVFVFVPVKLQTDAASWVLTLSWLIKRQSEKTLFF